MFMLIVALISLVVLIYVVYPLIKTKKDVSPDLQSVNAKLLEDQLSELDSDLEQGVIDQSQHQSARVDLQRTFLETASQTEIDASQHEKNNIVLIVALAFLLPSTAYFIYEQIGTDANAIQYMSDRTMVRQEATQAPREQVSNQQEANAEDPHTTQSGSVDVSAMVERVRKKAIENPDDLESWRMLAQSLQVMKDYEGAGQAYLHLIKKGVKDAEVYSRYADILATQAGGLLINSPAYQWTLKALEVDPNHHQSLWIAGTAAYYSMDYGLAKKYWTHLLSLLEPGTETYNAIEQNLAEVTASQETQ